MACIEVYTEMGCRSLEPVYAFHSLSFSETRNRGSDDRIARSCSNTLRNRSIGAGPSQRLKPLTSFSYARPSATQPARRRGFCP